MTRRDCLSFVKTNNRTWIHPEVPVPELTLGPGKNALLQQKDSG